MIPFLDALVPFFPGVSGILNELVHLFRNSRVFILTIETSFEGMIDSLSRSDVDSNLNFVFLPLSDPL